MQRRVVNVRYFRWLQKKRYDVAWARSTAKQCPDWIGAVLATVLTTALNNLTSFCASHQISDYVGSVWVSSNGHDSLWIVCTAWRTCLQCSLSFSGAVSRHAVMCDHSAGGSGMLNTFAPNSCLAASFKSPLVMSSSQYGVTHRKLRLLQLSLRNN